MCRRYPAIPAQTVHLVWMVRTSARRSAARLLERDSVYRTVWPVH
jgi:hypothetical protein